MHCPRRATAGSLSCSTSSAANRCRRNRDALDRRCPTPCETMPLCSLRNLRPVLDSLSSLIDLHCESISMPGLILHTSNQLDLLARRLSDVVSAPLGSPFTPEIVVVQSLASRRWLSFQIAGRQGICANYDFPFLSDFITQIVKKASPVATPIEKMSIELLSWKIDSLLLHCLAQKEFTPVAKYLRDNDSLKRFHLAARLANLFDQYRVYRPEMVSGWAASKQTRSGDEAWQAALWRQLGEAPGFNQALDRLRAHGFPDAAKLDLPERISIFAPTSLPPTYLEVLFQLARVRDIHLFILRPSREYRGNDSTGKQRARQVSTLIQRRAILSLLPGEKSTRT